jgi:hypothetical protein
MQLGRLGFISQVGTEEPLSRIEVMARQHLRDAVWPGAVLAYDISPTRLNQECGKHLADAAAGAGDQH